MKQTGRYAAGEKGSTVHHTLHTQQKANQAVTPTWS